MTSAVVSSSTKWLLGKNEPTANGSRGSSSAEHRIDGLAHRSSAARDVTEAFCTEVSTHTGLALGYECIMGAGVLGDNELFKRSAFVLEEPGNHAEKPD